MFDQVFGLPVHVLVVHAAVVFVPLTAVAAVVFAALPGWRWVVRWPLVGLAAVSVVTVVVALFSGEAFFVSLGRPDIVLEHRAQGQLLVWFVVALGVMSVLAALVLGGPTRLVDGRDRPGAARGVQRVVAVALVVAAVAAGIQVVRAGEAGARAAWGALPAQPSGVAGGQQPAIGVDAGRV